MGVPDNTRTGRQVQGPRSTDQPIPYKRREPDEILTVDVIILAPFFKSQFDQPRAPFLILTVCGMSLGWFSSRKSCTTYDTTRLHTATILKREREVTYVHVI